MSETLSLVDYLEKTERLPSEQLKRASAMAKETGQGLGFVMTQLGLISERALADLYEEITGASPVRAEEYPEEPPTINGISTKFLRRVHALPIGRSEDSLVVAMFDPLDVATVQALAFSTELKILPRPALLGEIDAVLAKVFPETALEIEKTDGSDEANKNDVMRLRDGASGAPVNLVQRTHSGGAALGSPPTASSSQIVGDFNGDGKTDVAYFFNLASYTFLSQGDGSFALVQRSYGGGTALGTPPTVSSAPPVIGDFNGDGKTDVAFSYNLRTFTFLSQGDGSFNFVQQEHSGGVALGRPPTTSSSQVVGDFNGDGKTDMAYFYNLASYTFLSQGNGTFSLVQRTHSDGVALGTPPTISSAQPVIGDLNGDGKTDVAFFYNLRTYTFLSQGDGSFNLVQRQHSGGASLGRPPTTSSSQVVGDFNGDGETDVAFFQNSAVYRFISSLHSLDLLTTTSVPSYGLTSSLEYLPLTSSGVYTKGTGATYPVYDYQGPSYVVSSLTSPNGIGGTYSSAYKYTGAQIHLTGRGFLGFASQAVTDPQTGVVQTTTFSRDFPYAGMPTGETKVLGNATLNSTVNTLAVRTLPWSGTYFPYVSQKVTTSKDLDGTEMPTVTKSYTYDAYGNATNMVNSTSDGASQTTVSTYDNDTTSWYLGRLTGSTVTNTTP